MPIYAYKCSACGHAQDMLRKLSDPVLTVCPECGQSTYSKQVTAAGFQLKGSGWYVTDFRNNSSGAAKASETAAGTGAPATTAAPAETASGGAGGKSESAAPATGSSTAGAGSGTSGPAAAGSPGNGSSGGAGSSASTPSTGSGT